MNNRLKQFLAVENISQSQFADSINIVRATVSHILSGRNNPSYDFIKALMERYPRLNIEWLIFGKGKMYKSPLTISEKEETPIGEGLFANVVEADEIPSVTEIPLPVEHPAPNISANNDINTLSNIIQTPINQRKISKVIVFFDDNTFKEI